PPNFSACLPFVQENVSWYWKVTSWSRVGPCGEGPRLKAPPTVTRGGAAPLGSSGITAVKPSAEGGVVSMGTALNVAERLEAKRSSFSIVGENVLVQLTEPA